MTTSIIGTKGLSLAYLNTAKYFVETQLHAQAIVQQYYPTGISDAGLATSIQNYQRLMKKVSNNYTEHVIGKFIQITSDANSFCNFSEIFISSLAANILESINNEEKKKELIESCNAMGNTIDDVISFNTSTLITELESIHDSFTSFQEKYDEDLTTLIEEAGQNVEGLSEKIDGLIATIAENIQGIITGAFQTGQGINDLGVGVLTELGGISSTKKLLSDQNKAKIQPEKEADTRIINQRFVISAIQLVQGGTSSSLASGKALQANNKALAALFQSMAQQESLLTVAKVIQVQNRFFYSAFKKGKFNVFNISDEPTIDSNWKEVKSSFSNLKTRIQEISNENDAQVLIEEINKSTKEWKSLKTIIERIITSFTE